jgi:hypothetical protein
VIKKIKINTKRRVIIVLGMHRSGTSAITAGLEILGVPLGDNLHPAGNDNPKGFWEDRSILAINEALLTLERSSYDSLGFSSINLESNPGTFKYIREAANLVINKLNEHDGIWGFKDPRTSRLLPFWRKVLLDLDCDVSYVIALRNPASIASSLFHRNGISGEKAYLLWIEHMLSALENTKGLKRLVVPFEDFLDSPYEQLSRIAAALKLSLPPPNSKNVKNYINSFLDKSLSHTRYTLSELRSDQRITKDAIELYEILEKASTDEVDLNDFSIEKKIWAIQKKFSNNLPLIKYVKTLEAERISLWEKVSQSNNQIQSLAQTVSEKESQILALHQTVGERDGRIELLNLDIQGLHNTGAERDNQIQSLAQTVSEKESQILALHQTVGERDGRIELLNLDIQGLHNTGAERDNQIQSLAQTVTERDSRIFWLERALKDSKNEVAAIFESNSWKITKPFRFIRREFIDKPKNKFISIFKEIPRKIWRTLPLSINYKNRIKNYLFHAKYSRSLKFSHIPFLNRAVPIDKKIISHSNEFVLKSSMPILASKPVRVICFYLPQYHEIPENNCWWGEGFTEWTNVKPASPNFDGHYQPHLPADLGYYDLLDNETQAKQVELAKLYGVEGFCFYFYWFGGKTLLEKPLLNYLHNSNLDLPFCLCWANENWSRRWDGLDSEILIEQSHSEDDDLDFISHIADYLNDDRYIRIDGKPLVIVYRPSLLPSAIETANRWRNWCRNHDVGEIYLAYTQSFENLDPKEYGFDAAIEFPPNNSSPPDITEEIKGKSDDFVGTIYDWRVFLERSYNYVEPEYTLFRSVCPSWDNTARRKERGTIFAKSEPFYYQKWLENAVKHTVVHRENEQERLVFINAWNEWAEGAHLEPDLKYGYAYLQATRDALASTNTIADASKLLLITHDCHPHGAQFLALEVARELIRNRYQISILALKGGKLTEEFSQLGSILIAEDFSKEDLSNFLKQCRHTGCNKVIASTTVSGGLLPELKAHGFKVLTLVHELPGVIKAMNLEESAKKIAEFADVVVFPAQVVFDQFETIAKFEINKSIIRPQGLLRKNPYEAHNEAAYKEVCTRHDLPQGARIVLNVGYLDYRKGPDLFVEIAALICKKHKDIYFIWVGHVDQEMESLVRKKIFEMGLEKYILLAGFNKEPFEYYAAATIFALTSREDPFPNVVLESVSVGVPVVAFEGATGAAEFIVEHGGVLAFFLDPEDFARKISRLLEESTSRAEVSLDNDFSLHKYVLDLMHYLDGTLRVSVIVPNYNYARLIQRRLDSICSQKYPIYEIIVLDDASNDDSSVVIKNYQKKSIHTIKFHENAVNSGSVFRQWTKGVEYASGDLIWIAEADDLSDELFLSTLVPAFGEENLVIAYCQSRQVDEAGNTQANDYLEYTYGLDNCWSQEYLQEGIEEIRKALTIKNSIPNVSAVLFKRHALINAFNTMADELFRFRVAGDWMVYLHVLSQGKIYFNPNSLNNHCRHSHSVTKTVDATNHLAEVKLAQEKALLMVEADQSLRDAATAYLKILCKHFGVNDSIIHESL